MDSSASERPFPGRVVPGQSTTDRGELPLYLWIAATLRERIANGTYPPGTELPTEHQLAAHLGVSRDSLRAGIAVLRGEGLLEGRRGFTPRVRPTPHREPIPVEPGETVIARMPTSVERARYGLAEGVPVLVLDDRMYPADQFSITGAPQPVTPPRQVPSPAATGH